MKRRDLLKLTDFATVPAAILLLSTRIQWGGGSIAALLSGLVLWTFTEYWLHRLAHEGPFAMARLQHAEHHKAPAALVGGTLYSTAIILTLCVLGTLTAPALIAGVLAGYLWFITLHFLMHHAPRVAELRPHLQVHHNLHHHFNSRRCYGVTTTLWDLLFGTAGMLPHGKTGPRRRG